MSTPTIAAPPAPRASTPSPSAPLPRAGARQRNATRRSWPGWKQVWFQLHWFIGITAGTVLMIIGLSGATISFKDELLDLMNPGVRHVAVETRATLTPGQLASMAAAEHGQRVASVTVYAEPGAAPRVLFAPKAGERRGESIYVHPYTGATRPALQGAGFFEWTESLHRWLLLPREPGRQVLGALALCLLGLALSGLYLRWPRRPLDWRTWLTFDPALKGRSFLWNLHAVIGTWCLVVYVMLTLTGMYWAYDFVRDHIDAWAGKPPRTAQAPAKPGQAREKKPQAAPVVIDTTVAWNAFRQRAGAWTLATVRMPSRAGEAVQFTWLAADAPHDRARSTMAILPADGQITEDKPYGQQGTGSRLVSVIYPLHMGTYFGLPGRIIVTVASLCMPLFGITGWMLYLGRRKAKRAVAAQRAMLGAGAQGAHVSALPTLVAYASQSGQAERLALESARALQQAGVPVDVQSLDQLTPSQLSQYERALIVASTFGEGEAPDGARRFARLLGDSKAPELRRLNFGLLALGDRHYTEFCGFGHALDARLRALGATALFPLIEVDKHDAQSLADWSQALARASGSPIDAIGHQEAASYDAWTLTRRVLLNAGSQGGALYEIGLSRPTGRQWEAGALAEIIACNIDGSEGLDAGGSAPHAPRSYSLASMPQDGELQLLVRQERHQGDTNGGYGVASGWLTQFAPIGSAIRLRLQANPAFAPALTDVPCIYIGNGSGLAGLRSHLRARRQAGLARNWLLFGERQRSVDSVCAQELEAWLQEGHLARLDRTFSRDGEPREYVQDRLRSAADELHAWLRDGAIIYVCGNLQGMAAGVDAVLLDALGQDGLDALRAQGRYRRDVY
ncbi:PepSY domain-containing protein [Janthinobacterium psychrotolerans]|uniref:Sulfite reductase (NADPH) flavoprotein alpha-component n=1 Tax=Janthinobacterium psychrotolerans TaxID=1747903 RepID=A0A1A7C148_9BURK|nr:sulfite reductase flavoprotein subunit alpha [Janthinobacterium psychrotolerans]OBV39651.1 sulfite reductase (NADPH) flavoprotein alpha-component [Janthinobacterium psychrotolerans]